MVMLHRWLFRILLLCLVLLPFGANAQEFTLIGGFVATPIGDHGKNTLPDGDFVKPGGGLMFESRNNPKNWPKGLGFRSHFTYQRNSVDNRALAEEFTRSLGLRTEVGKSKHSPLIITTGPSYDIYFSKVVRLSMSPQIGVLFNSTDSFTLSIFNEADSLVFRDELDFSNTPAFCYNMQADLEFTIVPDNIGLAIFAGYTRSRQKTQSILAGDQFGSSQLIQFLNTGIKIVLHGD